MSQKVYLGLIRIGDKSAHKIGRSINPKKRLQRMVWDGDVARVLATIPADDAVLAERMLHRYLWMYAAPCCIKTRGAGMNGEMELFQLPEIVVRCIRRITEFRGGHFYPDDAISTLAKAIKGRAA